MLNLKKFVEGLNRLPYMCGWKSGVVTVEESEVEGCIYVACDIHQSLVEDGEIYTPFYLIINEARSLFGNALIDSEIRETDKEYAPYDLFLTIRYKRKNQSLSESAIKEGS